MEQPPPTRPPESTVGATLPVELDAAENTVVARAEGHDWIALARDGEELVRQSGGPPSAEFTARPGSYEIRTDGRLRGVETVHRDPFPFPLTPVEAAADLLSGLIAATDTGAVLRLEVDAPARHPADGMPQLPADGNTSCTVTVRKTTPAGTLLKGRPHTDEVFLRATGGTLLRRDTDARVASVRLKSGRAAFRLVAEAAPRLVTVYAFTADPQLSAETQVEFV
ncbi:hypothetical protein [Streptomyces fulvoviolaceus]|uniref:hypothetical protein n=1 Tax=Streptomyces fulvoviolaceus TaxID=285535 RepID=UPI0004CAF404|nr:hypothetical protein [Streptomyces fulvoviolaceus]MCT9078060.1 hypothetical protein [Streptomyces fulvoviolaceus]